MHAAKSPTKAVKIYKEAPSSRLDEITIHKLNEQIAHEHYASLYYLHMASWCEQKGYEGAAAFLQRQSDEERTHMLKLIAYLHEMETMPQSPAIPAIDTSYQSLKEVFEALQAHEKKLTDMVHAIVSHALSIQDFPTFQFMQWFVAEQREEELLAKRALDLFDLIDPQSPLGLYSIDQALGKLEEVKIS